MPPSLPQSSAPAPRSFCSQPLQPVGSQKPESPSRDTLTGAHLSQACLWADVDFVLGQNQVPIPGEGVPPPLCKPGPPLQQGKTGLLPRAGTVGLVLAANSGTCSAGPAPGSPVVTEGPAPCPGPQQMVHWGRHPPHSRGLCRCTRPKVLGAPRNCFGIMRLTRGGPCTPSPQPGTGDAGSAWEELGFRSESRLMEGSCLWAGC